MNTLLCKRLGNLGNSSLHQHTEAPGKARTAISPPGQRDALMQQKVWSPQATSIGCGSSSPVPAAPAADSIALISRGTCGFAVKLRNLEAAGYDAAVVVGEN